MLKGGSCDIKLVKLFQLRQHPCYNLKIFHVGINYKYSFCCPIMFLIKNNQTLNYVLYSVPTTVIKNSWKLHSQFKQNVARMTNNDEHQQTAFRLHNNQTIFKGKSILSDKNGYCLYSRSTIRFLRIKMIQYFIALPLRKKQCCSEVPLKRNLPMETQKTKFNLIVLLNFTDALYSKDDVQSNKEYLFRFIGSIFQQHDHSWWQ